MPYMALYRRLRPQNFDSVVGQDHIVRTLKNQLESGRISHAYLFCGTRGTGKTSTAKIFAKAVNCHASVDGSPCGKCPSCTAIDSGASLNVVEIDAASNNGVDNIRDIREEVKYPPTDAKYKVYIIDEVHMLSAGAFNALLKTLEEPPEHVVFILATTDPQKIPATIHSRCQRMDFKRITTGDMTQAIEKYMVEEQVQIDSDALRYIASLSDGALRDALSLLDQCIAFYSGEAITLEKVLEITGSVDQSVFFKLCDALAGFDSGQCIGIIDEIVINGRDVSQFVSELILHLRNLLVAGSAAIQALDVLEETALKYKEQGEKLGQEAVIGYITEFSELQQKMKYAFNDRVLLETACIKLCNPAGQKKSGGSAPDPQLLQRLQRLEAMAEQGGLSGQATDGKKKPLTAKEAKPVQPKPKAVPEDIKKVISSWRPFTDGFDVPTKAILQTAFPGYLEGDMLYIVAPNPSSLSIIKRKEAMVNGELTKKFGREFSFIIMLQEEYDLRHKELYGAEDTEGKNALNEAALAEKLNGFVEFD